MGSPYKQLIGSKAERLFRLFDEPGKSNGLNVLADAVGVHSTVLVRWALPLVVDKSATRRGNGGNVPAQYNTSILEAADACGVPRAAVAALLDLYKCPTCGQEMPEGRTL